MNESSLLSRRLVPLTAVGALVLLAVAGMVLAGWYTHTPRLVELGLSPQPMPYNGAIGFVLAGLALLALAAGRPGWARVPAALIIVLGLATLAEYIFNTNLGFDQALMTDFIGVNPALGRMSSNSAFGFVLAGTGLLLTAGGRRTGSWVVLRAFLGSLLGAQALVTILGYLLGISTRVTAAGRMSLPSALLFAVLGAVLIGFAWQAATRASGGTPRWAGVLAGTGVLVAATLLAQALSDETRTQSQATVRGQAGRVADEMRIALQDEARAVDSISRRWETRGQPTLDNWQFEAGLYLQSFNPRGSVYWIDPAGSVRWSVAPPGSVGLPGAGTDPAVAAALQAARSQAGAVPARVLPLADGQYILLIVAPIQQTSVFAGYTVAVVDLQALLDQALDPTITANYAVTVREGETVIYRKGSTAPQIEADWHQDVPLGFAGLSDQVRVWPLAGQVTALQSPLPLSMFLAGLVTAILLGSTVYLAQRAGQRASQLRLLNADLRAEVAERERAESALRDLSHRTQLILDSAGEGIFGLDPQGCFTFVNPAAARLIGAGGPLDGASLTSALTQVAPDGNSYPLGIAPILTALREGQIYQSDDEWFERADGSRFPVEYTCMPIREAEGNPLGVVVTFADTTERRQAAEAQQAFTSVLQQSNRDLEEFAFIASHDLQEPLRKIQAFGDRLRQKAADKLGPTEQDYLARMQSAAGRMQTLITDLLGYSRVTTRGQAFLPVDLDTVARDVLSDLETRIEREGGRVALAPLPTLDADPLQMRQLLQNLIGNALKFHAPDRPPVVQVAASTLLGPTGDPMLCQISVADNGIGFDEKYLDRIFAPFQRLHGRTEYEGTGMGLAVCRKIAERHNGTITARSVPGVGTTFIVTLPLHQSEGVLTP